MNAAQLTSTLLHRFDTAVQYEWLETNGLGGYASSTVLGTHTRRYHGLLVSARKPPVDRNVLLSRLDETLSFRADTWELSTVKYEGAIAPRGYIFQHAFRQAWFPSWDYEVQGIRLRKTLGMPHGRDCTVIQYEVLEAPGPVTLKLKPLLSPRNIHDLTFANGGLNGHYDWNGQDWQVQPYDEDSRLHLRMPGAYFEHHGVWYHGFSYLEEAARGMEAREDLYCYGEFHLTLEPGQVWTMIASGSSLQAEDGEALLLAELQRRKALVEQAGYQQGWTQRLVLAADQFLVSRGDGRSSIMAGYPWFTDWGRDTMISLPGLCLATGREATAKEILQEFGRHIDQGMIPNRFPDDGTEPEYNTIDATLWLFVAAYHYVKQTQDKDFVKTELLPWLQAVMQAHLEGTRYGIHATEDGLLTGGEDGWQLTWMDAKAGDWVVTPRVGKCVEINALWYNAWRIYAYFLRIAGDRQGSLEAKQRSQAIKKAFTQTFWNEAEGCLFDCVTEAGKDASIRPNQVFALSLPFSLLSPAKAASTLNRIEAELYTPVGLRSLAPSDPHYIGQYEGDLYARDGAYHQGTVWSWLLGPYVDALISVRGDLGRNQAQQALESFLPHLYRAGIGNVSEIFDGQAPHKPRGCYAQAWGVAEWLRVIHQYELDLPHFDVTKPQRQRRTAIRSQLLPPSEYRFQPPPLQPILVEWSA